jgi:hypothetical protein
VVNISIEGLRLELIECVNTFDKIEQNEKQYIQNNQHHQGIARIPNG